MLTAFARLLPTDRSFGLGDRRRRCFDPRSLPAYGVAAAGATIIMIAVVSGAFDYDRALFVNVLSEISAFLAIAYAARWIGFEMIAAPLEMLMLFLLTVFLISFCTVVFIASNHPMMDAALARADSLFFGFDRRAVVAAVAHWPLLMTPTIWIYDSLAYTPQLLVVLLIVTRRYDRAWIVLSALTLTIFAAIFTLPFVPAYGTPPYAYDFVDIFDGIRAGTLRRLDSSVITGMVTFPSVHAADAVILAWGFSWLGRWAWPLVALNVLMIGSALIVGGHYLVDLIVGAGLGIAAMLAARIVQRWIDIRTAPSDLLPGRIIPAMK